MRPAITATSREALKLTLGSRPGDLPPGRAAIGRRRSAGGLLWKLEDRLEMEALTNRELLVRYHYHKSL